MAQDSAPDLETPIAPETTPALADSIATTGKDSVLVVRRDTLALPKSGQSLDAPVKYQAVDSIIYDLVNEKVYLYGKAKVSQDDIQLKAGMVVVDNNTSTVTAKGIIDTTGTLVDRPLFKESGREFESDSMVYNFRTRKGKITSIVTQEGDGFLRSEKVKKNEFDEMFAKNAFYTTCNLEHPHYKIQVDKVKVIPNELIVSGPAKLVIEDVPTPLILPFGLFPLKKGQRSGVLMPGYGFTPSKGYYLTGGGYYFGFGEYLDLAITGDVFSRGSWLLGAQSAYKRRYRYNGRMNIQFGKTRIGDPISPDFSTSRDFSVRWTHTQDPKARPNSSFNTSVNFSSSSFNREFGISNQDVLENTINSSINYRNDLVGTPFTLNINASHYQNLNTGRTTLTLPKLTANMARQFPFQRKQRIGKQKWYEKIGLTYGVEGKMEVQTVDSLLFTNEVFDDLNYGLQHRGGLSANYNLLKYITFTPSVNYTEAWYLETTRKVWEPESVETVIDPDTGEEIEEVIPGSVTESEDFGFAAARTFDTRASFSTKIFGLYMFKKGKIRAIRHEFTPTFGFTYRPDFSTDTWGYYQDITFADGSPITDKSLRQEIGTDTLYSRFEDGLYLRPGRTESASITFGVGNNLQMKYLAKSDTGSVEKKIAILDRLSLNSSYNLAADSLNLADFRLVGGTTLFNKRLLMNFSGTFDPYALNSEGQKINTFEWTNSRNLARLERFGVNFNTSFSSKDFGKNRSRSSNQNSDNGIQQALVRSNSGTDGEREQVLNQPNAYVDFNIPWDVRLDYTFALTRNFNTSTGEFENSIIQTVNLDGQMNITPKWKVGVNTGYDITNRQLSRTSIDIYRDLHCWEMLFNITPFGASKNYSFVIRVKSAMLQDLKLTRKRFWRDL